MAVVCQLTVNVLYAPTEQRPLVTYWDQCYTLDADASKTTGWNAYQDQDGKATTSSAKTLTAKGLTPLVSIGSMTLFSAKTGPEGGV
jgi:hypothetical protein